VPAPAMHWRSLLKAPQLPQLVDRGTQSATHSQRFPTMSKAPAWETQPADVPVAATAPLDVLQEPSGVPSAAACHSALVGSRFPAFRAAAAAWNQETYRAGRTPGIETA